ncbi:MAG TPA: hypothetical protein PKA64_22845, partial [Myxococcota bacterium]|nr:hypothetical protein [Myxococcota bacterium]
MAPLLLLTAALAAQARFDVGAEGWSGTAWREGHLTITNLDNRNDPPPGSLTIERAVGTLAGAPGFSAPNVLGFGGYAPGDGAAFGRFGSVDIVPDAIADAGRLDAFCFQGTSMELRLEAWRGGAVVGADQATLPGNYAMGHVRLEVRGVAFDRLRLVADPAGGDVAFLSIDDVLVGSPGDTGAPAADTDVVDTDAGDTDPADAEDTSDPRGEVGEGDDT